MTDKVKIKTAADLENTQQGIVSNVEGEEALRRKLNSMGIVNGSAIVAEKTAPMGDPRTYSVMGYQISLRNTEAALIKLR